MVVSCLLILFVAPVAAQTVTSLPAISSGVHTASLLSGETSSSSTGAMIAPARNPSKTPGVFALQRFNGGVTLSSFHESLTGWSTLMMPAVSYTINDTFSVDASIPIYFFRLAESTKAHPKPNNLLVAQRGELGDAVFALHGQFLPKLFIYESTFSFTAPTGDQDYPLTTGRVTFDLNNHFERTFGRLTPVLEIGAGDTTTLINREVTKTYTSLGPLAHFEVGCGIMLFRNLSFETDAYEQLPIGDQKIYSAYRKGHPIIVTGFNVTEDNGFISTFDVPLDHRTTFSSYYSRSLRRSVDTVGVSMTFLLRGAPQEESDDAVMNELFR
ncbi:MAG: hypothetical protein JSS95_00180 [Acidobacteria bacterium]|nr:hypothetical protein [Acidobacteriota bacterium]